MNILKQFFAARSPVLADPLDDPALRGMTQRELADLQFPRPADRVRQVAGCGEKDKG